MPDPEENFNTFSNLFVLPAIIICLYYKLWSTAALLTTLGTVSFLYHACQTELFCIFDSNVSGERNYFLLQTIDLTNVFFTIIWFIYYILEIKDSLKITAIFLAFPVLVLTFISDSEYKDAINWSLIGLLLIVALIYVLYKRKKIRIGPVSFIFASILLGIGVILFFLSSSDVESDAYNLHHGLFHTFAFLSLGLFVYTKFEVQPVYFQF
jgi:LPXTG-motif cell wall-anchored protein